MNLMHDRFILSVDLKALKDLLCLLLKDGSNDSLSYCINIFKSIEKI